MQHVHAPQLSARSMQPIFAGEVHTVSIDAALGPLPEGARMSLVSFAASAHTQWHTHDSDQLLFVISGSGHVGTHFEDLAVVPGDVVLIPAGEQHYHGAAGDGPMAHYSVLGGSRTDVGADVAPWPPAGGAS